MIHTHAHVQVYEGERFTEYLHDPEPGVSEKDFQHLVMQKYIPVSPERYATVEINTGLVSIAEESNDSHVDTDIVWCDLKECNDYYPEAN